ncbi:MAG: NAD(P)/FAD-dependent oxidoreductase [Pseudobutyrivibrio sp.]|nr:NAD(P)/FAD-dependent oxidoreductase [Pseudobutyrivibrio sp.]
MSKVIVIGGGAAGMMAAFSAASVGHEVILLEKNEKLGKKIYITGKGRCNFTNCCDTEDFFKNVVTNPKFLYSALYTYPSDFVVDFFESHGTATKVERGNRAFPVSDHASDITRAFSNALKDNHVQIKLNTKVIKLIVKDNVVSGVVLEDGVNLSSDHVIVCTGGLSYKTTGSTGDGLRFAKELDIKVSATRPALVPMECQEKYIIDMQGLSLKNVELSIYNGQKQLFKDFGEMLFTHFGVSGPLVLSASSKVGRYLETVDSLIAIIDLKPALSKDMLEDRLLREFKDNQNKKLITVVRSLVPASMVDAIIEVSKVDGDKQINSVTREERESIIYALKEFPFTITGLRDYNEAIVTQGGVAVKEIDPSTMMVKNYKGLSFAGEVIDVDAFTGGFNLQIAFSTGYLAGISID